MALLPPILNTPTKTGVNGQRELREDEVRPTCNMPLSRAQTASPIEARHHRTSPASSPSSILDSLGGSSAKRDRESVSENNDIAWKRLCTELSRKIIPAIIHSVVEDAYHILGSPFLVPADSLETLKANMIDESCLERIAPQDKSGSSHLGDWDTKSYEGLTDEVLRDLEVGGTVGLERLVGSILVSDSVTCQVLCAEVYNRDIITDPHAEPICGVTTSVPLTKPCTQYRGKLKVVKIPDGFGKQRLVIGVRSVNYLITSAQMEDQALVGPGHSSIFPVTGSTRIYFRKDREDPNMLKDQLLGLAQVRSSFGHLATYTTRRGALRGFASIGYMPVTIFTLSQHGHSGSRVFRELALRTIKGGESTIRMFRSDIEAPEDKTHTQTAELLRKLISLVPDDSDWVEVQANHEVEKTLAALASGYASTISQKNKIIANRIM